MKRAIHKIFSSVTAMVGGVIYLVIIFITLAIIFFFFALIFTGPWAPIIYTAVLAFLCAIVLNCDVEPFEASRVGLSLIAAWGAYELLELTGLETNLFSTFTNGPALIVASLFAGYLVWRWFERFIVPIEGEAGNRLSLGGGVLLAIFLMINFISPIVGHYFPEYWHKVTQWSDESRPGEY